MTGLLVSVRNIEEAETALRAGVDLIDVKEPTRGALGAASEQTIADIAKRIGLRRPISVALGELRDGRPIPMVPRNVAFAKIGLAGCAAEGDWIRSWAELVEYLDPDVTLVAVAYADWQGAAAPQPMDVLTQGFHVGCGAALLDTFDKQSGGLFDHCGDAEIRDWIVQARRNDMLTVLAGSLTLETIERAVLLQPDLVAVRGAACDDGRAGKVCAARIAALQDRLRQAQLPQASR